MILINEWLANPKGADARGEWIELANTGDAPVALLGWRLETKNGKKAWLTGEIGGGEFLILPKSRTKLTLTNRDEALKLFDASGRLADQSSFPGTAPEGQSFSRQEERFSFSASSPGQPNPKAELAMVSDQYSADAMSNLNLGTFGFIELALGVGILVTSAILFITTRHAELHNLLFRRDP